jgi:hypothetical protein
LITNRETQAWMAAQLRRRRALPRDPDVSASAAVHVRENDRLSPVEQLEIYREQFWLRHTSSLLEDFPGLSGVLGQDDWERLVEAYLEQASLSSFSLRELGEGMPAHVERFEGLPHRNLCADMARLEWAYVEIFDAADTSPLDGAKLASIPEDAWPAARIVFSPALRLLKVRYPVADLRRALRDAAGPVPIPDPAPQNLVVYRGADKNLFHTAISYLAYELIEALRSGTALGRASELAAERVPSDAADLESNVGSWFLDWGRRGWIVDVERS